MLPARAHLWQDGEEGREKVLGWRERKDNRDKEGGRVALGEGGEGADRVQEVHVPVQLTKFPSLHQVVHE